MKRGTLILLFVLLLACSVNAVNPDYTLEYDGSADLSEAGGKWSNNVSSPTFYFHVSQANAIRIDELSVTADKLWLYFLGGDKEVFFEDSNGKTQSVNLSDQGNDIMLKFINDNYNLGYVLEWDGSADLSEAGGKWLPNSTSPTFYFHVPQQNAISIVQGSITADKSWMYCLGEDREVFFEDSNGKTQTVNISDYGNQITFKFYEAAASDSTPPVCSQSDTNITVEEDSGSWTLDANMSLATNISCTDANALTYSVSSQSGSGGTFSLSSNDVLTFATDANATGTKIAVISVSDGTNTVKVSSQVIVSAVNDPPYLKEPIINKTWDEDTTAKINLDEYFADIDDSVLNYSYDFTSSSPINIQVTIEEDDDAVFTPDADWTGTEILTFTAYDSANLSFTSNEVILTVQAANQTSVNHPPNIDTIDPITDPTISVGASQTFEITKSDSDGDSMNVTWYVDGIIQEDETGDSFTYTATTIGSFVIKVAITDGQASDSNSWALTVKSAQSWANQTAPPGGKKVGENVTACGDGTCSDDEDQFSCCEDCGCPEGYRCNADAGTCRTERKASNTILLAVVLGLFVGGAGVGLYLYRKKQEQEIFGLASTPFETPPKESKKIEGGIKKLQEPVRKAAKEKPLKDKKTTSQILLKNYIITNLKKGKTLEQIKGDLRRVGWTEEQINDAYTAAQLDEAFS